ncbi:immunity 51 family protein [Hymenobacter sp. HSC-4F20]|uniref:immunity 51 family protein n=1 Tax=Hymenobacter sp. HSC-4F20 TaxID=2864135 RepID=UPI001C732F84|nr:immunity 51 family protein [Hymenobacter sp. HSC-4F20]MBX0290366.1 immunity 51 family protein [Hymenobacter sp. HSC-4F20]
MSQQDFAEAISPFFWSEHESSASVSLPVGEYKTDVFKARADEGFEGSGYDWASLAQVFLQEKMPQLVGTVKFDPEGSMYCAYSSDKAALKQFALAFKEAVEDEDVIHDLFSRAQLD